MAGDGGESWKVEETENELRRLNCALRAGRLRLPWFDDVIGRVGIRVGDLALVEAVPDGEGSWFGRALLRDGRALRFDLDASDPAFSTITDDSDTFYDSVRLKLKHKPWSREVVADRLRNELVDQNESSD